MKKLCSIILLFVLVIPSSVSAQSNSIGSGIALKFTGASSENVNLGDVYNDLTFPISVEAWLYVEGYPGTWSGIMASDNDVSKYNGFWVRIGSNGAIEIEFGDGNGSGIQFRRGLVTTTSVPLNKWTHLAVVCNSVSDVSFYFNGVIQNNTQTDGESSITTLTHSSAPASIGAQFNQFAAAIYTGQLDEIRLWNTSRGQNDLRNYMCRKVDPSSNGLIGHWTADESYSSNTVLDNTVPAENGEIVGTVSKITSGAAIGDESKYLYTENWSGEKITLGSPTDDQLTAKKIKGQPYGVHVYRVDSKPYFMAGLQTTPDYYYGIFCAESNTEASFTTVYNYSESNGIITEANEANARLKKRNDNTMNWTNVNAFPDTLSNTLTNKNHHHRKEFILNLPAGERLNASSSVTTPQQLVVFPNPASAQINISLEDGNISVISIEDVTGRIVKIINLTDKNPVTSIDISDLKAGAYLLNTLTSSGRIFGKFEVVK